MRTYTMPGFMVILPDPWSDCSTEQRGQPTGSSNGANLVREPPTARISYASRRGFDPTAEWVAGLNLNDDVLAIPSPVLARD
jgi:hypothetical protein